MRTRLSRLLSLALLCIVLLSGCGEKGGLKSADNRDNLIIATSFYPVYIMALNVAKDIPGVEVVNMTREATGCLHDYSVSPDDMKRIEAARIFITNGAGMESFMGKLIKQQPDMGIIDSSKGIELIKGEGDTGDNPHIWVSISNAILQVKNIGSRLAVLDPGNAARYKENTNTYVEKLEAEKVKMHKALDGLKNRNIITFHEAFPYFAREFNLNIAGVIEREPGSEPSARELAQTIDSISKLKVKALFAEPQYPSGAAEIIARETGARVYTLDPAVTGPMEEDAYINIMDNNLKVLQEALK